MKYGYIRVSTKEQNPDRQYIALEHHGVSRENIYLDKISGKDFLRPEYGRLLLKLKGKDLLVIKSIDRLGRNYGDFRAVEEDNKRDRRGHSGYRHAAFEYCLGPWRPYRGLYSRFSAADIGICGGDGENLSQRAAGRGNCCRQSEGSALWMREA